MEENAIINIYDPKVEDYHIYQELRNYSSPVLSSTIINEHNRKIDSNSGSPKKGILRKSHSSESVLPKEFVNVHGNPYSAAVDADAIVICTEWDEFINLDYERIFASMRKPAFLFDGRLILDHAKLTSIGFHVESIGKNTENLRKNK